VQARKWRWRVREASCTRPNKKELEINCWINKGSNTL
jgi:hypothetical protein